MAEPAVLWTDTASTPATPDPPAATDPPPAAVPADPLELRVQRLESTVAALQDTQALEDRLVERVTDRLQSKVAVEAERLSSAERRTTATAMMTAASNAFRSVAPLATPVTAKSTFLAFDIVLEAVAIFRMFFDFSYKVGWVTRILVLVLLPAILTSHLWFPGAHFWVIGDFLVKLVDLALAFVMFKALSREAQRYMQSRPS